MIVINSSTRQFNIPGADLTFGVEADAGSERKYFQCPRYVGNNLDVAGSFVRINYRNANGEVDSYLIEDLAVDGDNVTFSWELSPKVTTYKGNVSFVMCVVGPDTKVKWHTTLGRGQVLEGLEPESAMIEEGTADIVAALIAMVEAQTEAVENTGAEWVRNVQSEGTDQITAVQTAAQTAQSDAVAQIEAKGASTLATIPGEYTATVNAVQSAANAIRKKVSGEVIRVDDVSPMEHYPEIRVSGKNLTKSFFSNADATGYRKALHVECDLKPNTTYTLSFVGESGNSVYLNENISNDKVWVTCNGDRQSITFTTKAKLNTEQHTEEGWIILKNNSNNTIVPLFADVQFEVGNTASGYEPYIDPTTVTVRRCRKNILELPSVSATSNGVTFKPSEEGYIQVSGTATGVSSRQIYKGIPLLKTGYVTFSLSGNYTNIVPDFQLLDADNRILKQVQTGTSVTLNLDNYPDTAYWYIAIKRAENDVAVTGNVYLQVEPDMTATAWEKYEGETQIAASDGTVSGLAAVSPAMTLLTDTAGVNIECEYSRDTNAVIAEILEKITALGG